MVREAKLIQFKSTDDLGIRVDFPYSKVDVSRMHQLEDMKFHGEKKCWTCSLTITNINKLNDWQFDLDPKLNSYLSKPERKEIQSTLKIKGLRKKLYPFQEEGVSFIESNNGRVLLAHEMGLGKTVMSLGYLQMHPELRPAIIVVPASLKLNWEKEALQWMSEPDTQVIFNTSSIYANPNGIYIINYDILKNWVTDLKQLNPKVLILDECQMIRTNKTQRTKATKRLAKGIPHIIILSGTPIVNRPAEIYNAIKLVDPLLLPEPWAFYRKYCGLKHNGFGWDWTGATNTKELHQILTESVMLRKLKKDVLPDLPDKTRCFVPIELSNWPEYKAAEDDFIGFVRRQRGAEAAEKASNAEHLVQVGALKQIAVHGKIKQCIGWIEDFLEVGEKLVVFAVHREIISILMEHFSATAVKIDGGMTAQAKEDSKERFQTDEKIRLFIGNIKAAGVGITLTAASNVAFLELPWIPGELVQAEDRLHRIGQENAVTVHFLLARNTIEEKTARLLDKKSKVIAAVTDGVDVQQESLLSELINEYIN